MMRISILRYIYNVIHICVHVQQLTLSSLSHSCYFSFLTFQFLVLLLVLVFAHLLLPTFFFAFSLLFFFFALSLYQQTPDQPTLSANTGISDSNSRCRSTKDININISSTTNNTSNTHHHQYYITSREQRKGAKSGEQRRASSKEQRAESRETAQRCKVV